MIQITEIVRGYLTAADRRRAVAQLRRRGYDCFVPFVDVQSKFALCYGKYRKPLQLQLPLGGAK